MRGAPAPLLFLGGSELRDQVVQFTELEKLRKGTRVGGALAEGAAKFMTLFFGAASDPPLEGGS